MTGKRIVVVTILVAIFIAAVFVVPMLLNAGTFNETTNATPAVPISE